MWQLKTAYSEVQSLSGRSGGAIQTSNEDWKGGGGTEVSPRGASLVTGHITSCYDV